MIGVNRIGEGGGLVYEGGSTVLDPWGERIDTRVGGSALRTARISRRKVAEVRTTFPLGLGDQNRPD
jgi:predicted amidohydrolase